MIELKRCLAFIAVVSSLHNLALARIVYNDGNHHTLSSEFDFEVLSIENATSLTLTGAVRLPTSNPDNADIWDGNEAVVDVIDGSRFLVEGGEIQGGGEFVSNSLHLSAASAVLRDATLQGGVSAKDSTIESSGGRITGRGQLGSAVGVQLLDSTLDSVNLEVNGGIELKGMSHANVNGGNLYSGNPEYPSRAIALSDDSQFDLLESSIHSFNSDGFSSTGVSADGNAILRMRQGEVIVSTLESSSIFGIVLSENSRAVVEDSTISMKTEAPSARGVLFRTMGDSDLTVLSGEFKLTGEDLFGLVNIGLHASDRSRVTLNGSTLVEDDTLLELRVEDRAEVMIIGGTFNYPLFEPIVDTAGTIIGTLNSGEQVNWDFERHPTATVVLVPEPNGLLATSIALFGFVAHLRIRRR